MFGRRKIVATLFVIQFKFDKVPLSVEYLSLSGR
jgi:hypothetical protein